MDLHDDMTATIFRNGNYVAENLVIPEYVLGNGKFYKVTSIGGGAFNGSMLTGSLTIPNSVTSIGDFAFAACAGLRGNLTIPNSVTSISTDAFYGCTGLTGNLIIGSNVNSIGNDAFRECNFDDIDIDSTNPTYGLATNVGEAKIVVGKEIIGGEEVCLKDYNSHDIAGSLAIGQLIIPSSVTIIGDEAFRGCTGLTGSITIPDSVNSIGIGAFGGCGGLTGSLTIPNSVTNIGNLAFQFCSGFTNITLYGFDANPSWAGSNIFNF
jgi:hypothetical protein